MPQAGPGQRAQVPEQHDRRGQQWQRAEHQGAPDQRPLDELAVRRALFEVLLERLPVLGLRTQFVPLLDHLDVRHQVPHPKQRAQAESDQRDGKREAQGQVGPEGGVYGVNLEADVGGYEAAAGDKREDKARRDYPFDPLGVHDHPRVVRREADDVLRSLSLRALSLRDLARTVAALGHGRRPEQARRGRGSADHPMRRSRARVPLGLFHVAHDYCYSIPVGLGSRRLTVIHIAISTRKPIPPRKTTRPSVTGPIRPSEKPPGLGSTLVCVM